MLLSFDSLTLGEIVRLTNKYSNNVMARDLLLTMGERRYGAPATVDKGIAAVEEWSRTRGLDLHGALIGNGAGLSRTARISAATLVKVLKYAYHSRYAPEFLASLPIAGVDGTLRTSMRDTPPGAVRLKTGHIDEASAVAGYVSDTARTHVHSRVPGQRSARRRGRGRARACGARRLDFAEPLTAVWAPVPRARALQFPPDRVHVLAQPDAEREVIEVFRQAAPIPLRRAQVHRAVGQGLIAMLAPVLGRQG